MATWRDGPDQGDERIGRKICISEFAELGPAGAATDQTTSSPRLASTAYDVARANAYCQTVKVHAVVPYPARGCAAKPRDDRRRSVIPGITTDCGANPERVLQNVNP